MNILVLGSGGREHAISWALAKSPQCDNLYVAPGNGGTSAIATNVAGLSAESGQDVLAFAQEHAIEMVKPRLYNDEDQTKAAALWLSLIHI